MQYDKNDMRIDSHWTSKKLSEMTERDWRIFREDFNIAYRGSNPPLPYRNWDECPLPKQLRKAIEKVRGLTQSRLLRHHLARCSWGGECLADQRAVLL